MEKVVVWLDSIVLVVRIDAPGLTSAIAEPPLGARPMCELDRDHF